MRNKYDLRFKIRITINSYKTAAALMHQCGGCFIRLSLFSRQLQIQRNEALRRLTVTANTRRHAVGF